MIETHFTNRDLVFLITGFVLFFSAVILFHKGKTRAALGILIAGGFTFRLLMAFIDPFVHIWDEQYHALVAKNIADDFFHPVLVKQPIGATDPAYWAYTETWLHKPPLFLWQMGISIKIFGPTVWAIRIPSVIVSTLMIPAVYRMGKVMFTERTGFIAALLVAGSNILINVVSGFVNTDHNDVVFAGYVCFSFWAWMEYVNRPRLRWIILTGIFAGAAILTKWLPGLMVFGAWGITLVLLRENRLAISRWKDLLISFATSVAIAAPWFIYARFQWPMQWKAAMSNYSSHLSDDMTHTGEWWYHFAQLAEQNGIWFVIVLLCAIPVFLMSRVRKEFKMGLIFSVAIVYSFYSFVAARMPLFCLSVLPLLILMVSVLFDRLAELLIKLRPGFFRYVVTTLLMFVAYVMVDQGRIEHYHTLRDPKEAYRRTRLHNQSVFLKLNNLPDNTVVFNCGDWNAIPCMFYTRYTAYDYVPGAADIQNARELGRTIAVFDDGQLPEFITQDPGIVILEAQLIRNGY